MSNSPNRKEENPSINRQSLRDPLFQISESEASPFISDYNLTVILPNSLSLIIYTCLSFALYICIETAIYNHESNVIIEYEHKYLLDLETKTSLYSQGLFARVESFVNMYRETMELNFTENPPASNICNQSEYFCENSSFSHVYSIISDKYDLIKLFYYQLELGFENETDDCEVFVYYHTSETPLLQYRFGDGPAGWIGNKIIPYLKQFEQNTHYIQVLNVTTSTSSKMKILFCGIVPSLGQNSRICLITGDLEATVYFSKSNPTRISGSNMLIVTEEKVAKNLKSELEQESEMVEMIVASSIDEEDKEFFSSFHFRDCISEYDKIEKIVTNKIRICSPPMPKYIMSPLTIFANFEVEVYPRYYLEDLVSTAKADNFSINYFIYSNESFFQNESKRIKNFNLKQSYFIHIMAVIVAFWLLLMPIFPLKLINTELSQTVSLLIKMCKSVKSIKNKDDVEIQGDIFGKLNNEMFKKHHIFASTIEFFKYFIWYRKWLYTTKNSKRKNLLEEGLTLFGEYDYAPVLVYIYKKEIERELRLVKSYKKMRKIFSQRFLLFQGEDKIEGGVNNGKGRTVGRKVKKSALANKEDDNDKIEKKDYCVIDNMDRDFENRINKQLEFMEVQKKNKRYVRFSNDLQEEDKPFQYRVSKFLLNNPSQSSILKASQKSIEEDMRKEDVEIGSNPFGESSREDAKDQESEFSEKNEENWDLLIKFDQLDELGEDSDEEEECFEIKRFSLKKLDEKITPIYQNIVDLYTSKIIIKKMYLEKQSLSEITEYINDIYRLEIEKLRYHYKCLKHKSKQREQMLKELSRKLITLKKEKRVKDVERERGGGSQKWLEDTISVIESEIIDDSKGFDLQFENFTSLEENYKINGALIERARLYQMKMLKIMNYPIPYKKLESLCGSNLEEIRVEAKVIMGSEFFHISPHADYEVLMKAHENLTENHTTHSQKQKTLKLIKKVLKNREILEEEESQIELIKNYYNYAHKKFYFVSDLSDSYEVFRPTLAEIYKNMGQTDMYQIINLAMNEVVQDMIVNGSEIKPSKLTEFETKFENFYNESTRIKSVASTKANGKRMTFEKDFNRIISKIEQEDINLSKFIVLILGGENETQSKTHEDFESSSAQNRQVFQVVHQEILTKMDRNYFHVILVGHNLKDYTTRQGKLKKYARNTHDLLEIDLSKAKINEQFKELYKYLNK